ncbi:hypothetical protein [Phormidium tenue]|uniref:Uncharacterized protein n=1 Tax=Phormidium tenue NIES-30 TaxID=549789 RepID=A0A1U7IY04_9CYAN|nr:hypothetical protein [Phormidium tenue]MBD2234943.1 hypothetical protein [Phormidium tenue FACHB-1052]OKH43441.1 hypothetical protein NIES30_24840 [Phormidium tenue NIES-30]
MNRVKQASTIGGAILIVVPLIGDKIMDMLVAVFNEGELTLGKFGLLLGSLFLVGLMVWVVQSGILKLFSDLIRKFRRTDEVEDTRGKLKIARKTIKQGLEYLKVQQSKFDTNVSSASQKVIELNAMDRSFTQRKRQAAGVVMSLKKDYRDNLIALEKAIEQLYKNINDAENILEEADEWSRKAAKRYYKGPN